MSTKKEKEVLLCLNELKDHVFFQQFEPIRQNIDITTSNEIVAEQLLQYGYKHPVMHLEQREANLELFEAGYEKIVILENKILECGLVIDVCRNYSRGQIYIIRKNKRLVNPRLYQTIGAHYVVNTNNENDISFIFKTTERTNLN
ncbi:hypothetical protein [Alkalihalobacterium bogoriense]|uniref:hypothetical protein n=1 Tax=Alkalihalobacterium bogoriense TaxID=246272 RepID=UPI00047A63A4|nr:hypothetical protein [Alkalihalobacterium bogoriense]